MGYSVRQPASQTDAAETSSRALAHGVLADPIYLGPHYEKAASTHGVRQGYRQHVHLRPEPEAVNFGSDLARPAVATAEFNNEGAGLGAAAHGMLQRPQRLPRPNHVSNGQALEGAGCGRARRRRGSARLGLNRLKSLPVVECGLPEGGVGLERAPMHVEADGARATGVP